MKRLVDVIFSGLGLIVLGPMFVIISLLIRFGSAGPIFFRQTRVGLGGQPFQIFKFRTMEVNDSRGALVTSKNDNRITKIGALLRLSKFDEFPQLINVFNGEMSLVGPRPEIPELVEFYTDEQRKLLTVKPGMTSPATIYYRDEEEIVGSAADVVDYHRHVLIPRKAAFDLVYVKKVSLLYDLKIIFLTLTSVMLNQSGYMRETTIKNRKTLIVVTQGLIACIAYMVAYQIRFDWQPPHGELMRCFRTMPMAVLIQMVCLSVYNLTEGFWRYIDIYDFLRLAKAVLLSVLLFMLFDYFFLAIAYPTGVSSINGVVSFLFFSVMRLSTHVLADAYGSIRPAPKKEILVYGFNDRARSFIDELRKDSSSDYRVLGIIDADTSKKNLSMSRIPVLGGVKDLDEILLKNEISFIVNSNKKSNNDDLLRLVSIAAHHKIRLKTLPSLSQIFEEKVAPNFVRDLQYEDFLHREALDLDNDLLRAIYCGKTVMITGGGGSIGSELARQIAKYDPKELVLFDKDESLLYDVDMEFRRQKVFSRYKTVVGDVKDRFSIDQIMSEVRPEIVLHAAAYKHVPLMERFPREAFSNNVFGSLNVMQAAAEHGVSRFVLISTDKAVRSTNVMGATKALIERLMYESVAPHTAMKCMAVRFGNVLGSRGSVIPVFQKQIDHGGPVTVTDPKVERFFMSIAEAAQLVLQAGAMGGGGELYILRMGERVRLKDLACQLIECNGLRPNVDIHIEYIGLRPGEKLIEELLTDIEGAEDSKHAKIMKISRYIKVDETLYDEIQALKNDFNAANGNDIVRRLQFWVHDYKPVCVDN